MRLHGVRAHLRTNIVGYIALTVAFVGVPMTWAVARDSVGSRQLKPNAVKNTDIADDAVRSPEVADGSLLGEDFADGELSAGAQGPQGPQGVQGIQGPAGSPDTPAEVLAKLAGVDGEGSGLDADRVDGGNPVSGQTVSSIQGESGATVSFTTVTNIPGVGQLQGDCNKADPTSSADTRLDLATGVDARITVDSGGSSASTQELFSGAASSAVNSPGFTATDVDFQIWRVIAFPKMVTIFVEVSFLSVGPGIETCQWFNSYMLWTE